MTLLPRTYTRRTLSSSQQVLIARQPNKKHHKRLAHDQEADRKLGTKQKSSKDVYMLFEGRQYACLDSGSQFELFLFFELD